LVVFIGLIFLFFNKIERSTGRYNKQGNCPVEERGRGISEIIVNLSKVGFRRTEIMNVAKAPNQLLGALTGFFNKN